MSQKNQASRRYDLDWIRVLAILFVFLYHNSMFFNPFPWHVKNNVIDTSYIYTYSLLVGNWIMPVFFAVSGISTFYALQKRNGAAFLKERLLRLGIPLVFGVMVLSPPQVYMERVSHGQFSGSFWNFYPHYFDGVYLDIGGTGNFAFFGHHLWYLLELLIFSFITLPFFQKRKNNMQNKPFTNKHYFLLLLPLVLIGIALNNIVNLGGWGLFFYIVVYIYGYSYFARESFRAFVMKSGAYTGTVTIVSLLIYVVWALHGFPANGTLLSLLFTIVRVIMVWNSLFFILYLGEKYLTKSNKFLTYTSEASMPFYVLHQPVIMFLGFLIYNLSWPVSVKLIFLAPTAFLIIMCLYHFIFRHVNVLRVLVGMRMNRSKRFDNRATRVSSIKN